MDQPTPKVIVKAYVLGEVAAKWAELYPDHSMERDWWWIQVEAGPYQFILDFQDALRVRFDQEAADIAFFYSAEGRARVRNVLAQCKAIEREIDMGGDETATP
jgi:hypothetical protein